MGRWVGRNPAPHAPHAKCRCQLLLTTMRIAAEGKALPAGLPHRALTQPSACLPAIARRLPPVQGRHMYGQALPLLPKVAAPDDLLVLNFGIHHGKEYSLQLRQFVAYWKAHRSSLPRLLWQQSAAQHFNNPAGDGQVPGGKPPFQCARIPHFRVVVSVCAWAG